MYCVCVCVCLCVCVCVCRVICYMCDSSVQFYLSQTQIKMIDSKLCSEDTLLHCLKEPRNNSQQKHTHTYVCVNIYIHIHTYIYIYVCMYVYMYVYVYISTKVCSYITYLVSKFEC